MDVGPDATSLILLQPATKKAEKKQRRLAPFFYEIQA